MQCTMPEADWPARYRARSQARRFGLVPSASTGTMSPLARDR